MMLPTTWADALAAKAAAPDLLPIAGGTDVMVEMNFDRSGLECHIEAPLEAIAPETSK